MVFGCNCSIIHIKTVKNENIAVVWCAFQHQERKRKRDGKTKVYASITINKEKVIVALPYYVNVESWDKGRGCVKVGLPEAKESNTYLEQVKFTITNYYRQLQIAGKEITPDLLKVRFLGEVTEETYSLSRLMDYHYEVASAALISEFSMLIGATSLKNVTYCKAHFATTWCKTTLKLIF